MNNVSKQIGICVVTYNRPNSLSRLLACLSTATYPCDVELIISIDNSGVIETKQVASEYVWPYGKKRIICHSKRLGLREHILSCGNLLKEFDALVILEDDISVAQGFFFYVQQCVDKFYDDDRVAGISLYNFPIINYKNLLPFIPLKSDSDVYFMKIAQSWGQVWMKNSWFEFVKWYGENSEEFGVENHLPEDMCNWPKTSWLKYHRRYCIEKNKYFVYPYISLSTNNSAPGEHFKSSTDIYQANILWGDKMLYNLNPKVFYDGFFENESIASYIGVNSDDICVDFYNIKQNRESKRYWLTRAKVPYKIIKSFALSQKPYEWNVINDNQGNDLFLYDTSIHCKNKFDERDAIFYRYIYTLTGINLIFKSFVKHLLATLKKKIFKY